MHSSGRNTVCLQFVTIVREATKDNKIPPPLFLSFGKICSSFFFCTHLHIVCWPTCSESIWGEGEKKRWINAVASHTVGKFSLELETAAIACAFRWRYIAATARTRLPACDGSHSARYSALFHRHFTILMLSKYKYCTCVCYPNTMCSQFCFGALWMSLFNSRVRRAFKNFLTDFDVSPKPELSQI